MRVEAKQRGRVGWHLALTTKRYRRSLLIERPTLTKLSRTDTALATRHDGGG